MAASATFALKAGVWFRRGRLFIVSPDSRGTACPLSGRNSTYRPVQILEAGSVDQFIRRHNVENYCRLLESVSDETERQTILKLLAEERQKQKDAGDKID
jgi:hypothetical protein